jgi:hypothetical protein
MKIRQNSIITKKIIQEIETLDVAWYLVQEVKEFLKYVSYYKLKNILKNIEQFWEYLKFIDCHNTTQVCQLEYDDSQNIVPANHDITYYISQRGLSLLGENKLQQKLQQNDYSLSYIMQWVKWLLLLTVDEFCNASPTRMSINRMLRKKDKEKKQLLNS